MNVYIPYKSCHHRSISRSQELPTDFCDHLAQLQVLDLRENKIERLPEELNQLQALVRLNLAQNSLNSVPTSLAQLAKLESLQLEGNPIRSIRQDILNGGTHRVLQLLRERAAERGQTAVGGADAKHNASAAPAFPDK